MILVMGSGGNGSGGGGSGGSVLGALVIVPLGIEDTVAPVGRCVMASCSPRSRKRGMILLFRIGGCCFVRFVS